VGSPFRKLARVRSAYCWIWPPPLALIASQMIAVVPAESASFFRHLFFFTLLCRIRGLSRQSEDVGGGLTSIRFVLTACASLFAREIFFSTDRLLLKAISPSFFNFQVFLVSLPALEGTTGFSCAVYLQRYSFFPPAIDFPPFFFSFPRDQKYVWQELLASLLLRRRVTQRTPKQFAGHPLHSRREASCLAILFFFLVVPTTFFDGASACRFFFFVLFGRLRPRTKAHPDCPFPQLRAKNG